MSTKIFLGIMLIVLAVAGYVVYHQYLAEEEATPLLVDGISFSCTDGSYFVAEFNQDFSRLNVFIDGILAHSLTRVTGTDAVYEYQGEGYAYRFAGEEARVTDPTGDSLTCTQPFDPNNAPYNFGDRGEGDGATPDTAAAVNDNILGVWQSADDTDFTREFRAAGIAIDRYQGSPDTEGTWTTFTSTSGVTAPFDLELDAVYLEMRMGGEDEILYFKLTKLTPEELELVYLGRGGVLRFTYAGPAR